jgi:hypothetical protein
MSTWRMGVRIPTLRCLYRRITSPQARVGILQKSFSDVFGKQCMISSDAVSVIFLGIRIGIGSFVDGTLDQATLGNFSFICSLLSCSYFLLLASLCLGMLYLSRRISVE